MRPARGPAWDAVRARAVLPRDAADRFDEPALVACAPDPGVRAALLSLTGTSGAALVGLAAAGGAPPLGRGPLASPGRVIGPGPAGERWVNERYGAEHPALVAPSLVHALLAGPEPRGHDEEALLHALLALVHLEIVLRDPPLAALGTELCRRQNSLALTLFNSRPPGGWGLRIVCPDGPGTIPGGAPRMQSPDFWSVPFAPPGATPAPATPALCTVLTAVAGAEPPAPLVHGEALARWVDEHLDSGWLGPADRVTAGRAVGALA
jgi:hypothetical protein